MDTLSSRTRVQDNPSFVIGYRRHSGSPESPSSYRVWHSSWHNDQFELMERDEFERLIRIGKRFSISFLDFDEIEEVSGTVDAPESETSEAVAADVE